MFTPHILVLCTFATFAFGRTVTYNWDVTWVDAAPDGFSRPVIGINGQWPCPVIEVTRDDQIVINLSNLLGNESTSLHFHGISQNGSPEMDGPSQVSQCPIPPGSSFTYSFTVDSPGTYWYHSHNMGQYPDGLRGPLIVQDPADPYAGQFDEEIILTTTDWYHDQAPTLIPAMLLSSNTNILPPFPVAGLFNDNSAPVVFNFSPGKTYKVRVISMSAFVSTMLGFDSHTMEIIEIDSIYTQKKEAQQIRITPAQRYTFLMKAKSSDNTNYGFLGALDTNKDFTQPGDTWQLNMTGYIMYNNDSSTSTTTGNSTGSGNDLSYPPTYVVDSWDPLHDMTLTPLDNAGQLGHPDQTITMNFNFGFDNSGIPRAYINNETYVSQKVPTLYSVLSTGSSATNPVVYGQVNPVIVSQNSIVDIVLNNLDDALHPFHLHGHQFQMLARPPSGSGSYTGDTSSFPSVPARRDTINVNGDSYMVIRFQADNPGVQLFHCHIEWHVEMGLTATIIEAPEQLQQSVKIPQDHLDACNAMGIPTQGNAAGNTKNYTDLTGANTQSPNPDQGALYISSTSRMRAIRRALTPDSLRKKWLRIYQTI